MKMLGTYTSAIALVGALTFSGASQAATVWELGGFDTGPGLFDSGEVDLLAGDYTLDLDAFAFLPAGPIVFGITNLAENFQVAIAPPGSGSASFAFTTLGGTFDFLIGGNAGLGGTLWKAEINSVAPVPLPAAAWMLGSALVGLVTVGRRKLA
jgi:hypothetical protein